MSAKKGKAGKATAAKGNKQPLGSGPLGADLTPGGIEADDLFGLGGDFAAQSGNDDDQATRAVCLGSDGDELASTLHDNRNEVSVTYQYCADSGNIDVTNLYIGKVSGGFHIDGFSVAYSNSGYPQITVNGHNHDNNAHADTEMVEFKPSITLPAGFGVPDLFVNADANSSPQSATYTLAAEHNDVPDKDGEHLAGDNYGGTENIVANYYGSPSLTTTGWDVTSTNSGTSNSDFDTTDINATKSLARYVAP